MPKGLPRIDGRGLLSEWLFLGLSGRSCFTDESINKMESNVRFWKK